MIRIASITAILVLFVDQASPACAETSIPIRQIRLPLRKAGLPIYGIPVRIGATIVEAGLDTGSVGLRVLPGTLRSGDAQMTLAAAEYSYGSGVVLSGRVGETRLAIGEKIGQAKIQLVEKVGCTEANSDCPGKGNPPDYRLEGQGLPGAGFRAIAGLRLPSPRPDGTDNPLAQIGARGYIIDLPHRDEAAGRLIVDPAPGTTRGFAELPNARDVFPHDDSVPANTVLGCLFGETPGQKICGTILFDTGAPGIAVTVPAGRKVRWPNGTRTRLVLGDGHHHAVATEDFVAGPAQNSGVSIKVAKKPLRRATISIGLTPFLAFSVLYQPSRHGIAVRPRPPVPGGPVGRLEGAWRG